MNIVNSHLFLLLLLCPGLLFLIVTSSKRLHKRFIQYAQSHMMSYYYRKVSPFWVGFRLFILVLALAAIVLALVRPQWDYAQKNTESSGMDIIFAIDISKSMDAQDMMPSRLMRAVIQISAFLDQVKSDRIGIITFAGVATVECPLTDDYEAIKIVLSSLSTDNNPKPGTNISAALKLAADSFGEANAAGSLILISDGEDLAGGAEEQAKLLKARGIRLYSMGVGSPDGYKIVHPETGEEVLSKLDEKSLIKLAKISGAEYYPVTPGGEEIQLILQRIYRTEEERISKRSINVFKEQYHLFAGLAILLLLLESIIDPRRRKGLMAAESLYES